MSSRHKKGEALRPFVRLGRADCGDVSIAMRKEWLVTNGLGGYAAGTVSGANTRGYHGLLVASLRPPLERTVLVAKVDTVVHYGGKDYPLFTNEFADGRIDPHGYRHIESFCLEGSIPVWKYALADIRLEQRIWMHHEHNTTYVTYTLTQGPQPVSLTLTPLCTYRDYHSHTEGGWSFDITPVDGGFEAMAFEGAQPYRVLLDQGKFLPDPAWYRAFGHRVETYRGQVDSEDLLAVGRFSATLQPGETLTLICSTKAIMPHAGLESLHQEQQRQMQLVQTGKCADAPAWIKQLALAADQFIVRRSSQQTDNDSQHGTTVIAGYPWFGDWGRDTMIALPGLTLATNRSAVAASILQTFAKHISQGMLPNRFPDEGEQPEYNTVDATLWYFQAIYQHFLHTGKRTLIKELYPVLQDVIEWHDKGTRYHIHVDPSDGLLYAGEPHVQLTWMDVKVDDWVVTPRIGKPVEINALWFNALRLMAEFATLLRKSKAAEQYHMRANVVSQSFQSRFWYADGGYLYDVIDGPEGAESTDGKRYDVSLRPNQLFAISLPFALLDESQAKSVVDVCAHYLWTSYGIRSLTPTDPAYIAQYGGDRVRRDGAYHQGTVWSWLVGPFALAHYAVYRDSAMILAMLEVMEDHLADACLGSISEIFDGDPPHAPRGAFAQAWSVAEVLRVWRIVQNEMSTNHS
ncbi:MAG: amylo-alpha-1,6-glucosidase [Chloroflexota bacterium]